MKRVLEILTYINGGGAAMVVYNYLSHMNRNGLHVDVLALEQPFKPFLEDQFKDLGVGVYYLPKKVSKRIGVFKKLIHNNRYDVIHSHCEFMSEIYLGIAMLNGVKTRIIHSHMAGGRYSKLKNLYAPIGRLIAKKVATHYFGCGIDACKSMWGEKAFNQGKCYVLNNAIDIQKFRFNSNTRNDVRKEMGWENHFVVVNVGRFVEQKNHKFLIDVFHSLTEQRKDSLLVLIGEGPLKDEVEKKVKELTIEDRVIFLGLRDDVARLMNGADVFFLPSLFEGLPIVSIEAQTNGLPIVMSEGVTHESGITNIASFVSFNSSMEVWVNALLKKQSDKRDSYSTKVQAMNFDLSLEAAKLRNFYISGSLKI